MENNGKETAGKSRDPDDSGRSENNSEDHQEEQIIETESDESTTEVEDDLYKWYVIHSFSGYELKVRKFIEGPIAEKYPGKVSEVMIPTEQITHSRSGKKITREKKLYPGYVFAKLDLADEMIMEIRAMSNVSGFPPMNKGYPVPLDREEVERIIGQAEGKETSKSVRAPFSIGQSVRVISGPFNNFSGVVEMINPERGRVRVIFTIFGRKAPVELDFSQVRIN